MKIAVYGTLKRGHHNNVLLSHAQFLHERIVDGYKLLDSGFPVAVPCKDSRIKVEIFEFDDEATLARLDRLESNGRMYIRTPVEDFEMYVGNPPYWRDFHGMEEVNSFNGLYEYHSYQRRH